MDGGKERKGLAVEIKGHHLFMIDADPALVGVIGPLDVLRRLEE